MILSREVLVLVVAGSEGYHKLPDGVFRNLLCVLAFLLQMGACLVRSRANDCVWGECFVAMTKEMMQLKMKRTQIRRRTKKIWLYEIWWAQS